MTAYRAAPTRTISMMLATAVVLGATGTIPARAEPAGAGEPAAEVPHELFWNEVKPAPIPSGVPYLKSQVADADAQQSRAVDVAGLRSLFVNRRFAQLTNVLESLQASFEKDPQREEWVSSAYWAFGSPHPKELELIEAWLEASPRSFAPHLARGLYWYSMASLQRGAKSAHETSDHEFRSMREALRRAIRDLRGAQALRPRLVFARTVEFDSEFLLGDRARAEALMESVLAACPSCYWPRDTWLARLEPRWGGSFEEMEEYAARGQTGNRRHRALQLRVQAYRAWEAEVEGRKDEARALRGRVCAVEEGLASFAQMCADEKAERSDFAGAVSILDRAVARYPGNPVLRLSRAWYLAKVERWEDAGKDLLYGMRCDPTSGRRIRRIVVPALDALGWRAHSAGRKGDAVRLYSLALDLAPANEELAARAQQASTSTALATGSDRADPLAGDGRPELRVSVLDRTGRPVSGAPVQLYPGARRADEIARATKEEHLDLATDVSGRLRAPVRAGEWTVVAWLPAGNRGSVGWVSVPVTGADLTLTFSGPTRERVTGKVVDTGRPPAAVPGLKILALPEAPDHEGGTRAIASATSGADGSFVLEGLDEGPYRIFPLHEMYYSPERGQALPRGERRMDLEVQRMQLLRGRVLIAKPGMAPSPAEQIVISSPNLGKRVLTTVDGRFSLFFMAPFKESPVDFSVEGRPPVTRTLDLTHLDNDAGDVIVGGGRTIRGRVVGDDGAPIWKAVVSLESGRRLADTAIDGSFDASLQDGPAKLVVGHADWLPATRAVLADEDDLQIELRAGGRFRVLLMDEDGAPLGDARVHKTGSGAACLTGPSGRCELKGIRDDLECIYASSVAGSDGLDPPALCVPTSRGAVQSVAMTWPRSRTRLTVRVVDTDGEPIDAPVRAFVGAEAISAVVDAQGRPARPFHDFRSAGGLRDLPHGRYLVVARNAQRACSAALADLRTADEVTVTLRIGDGTCSR